MRLNNGFDISASALTAQRLRLDVVASNIANANTTRGELVNGKWVPYTRKLVELQSRNPDAFQDILNQKITEKTGQGVRVSQIYNDPTPYKTVYDPTNPDADENGNVQMPNVDIMKEMVDMISASRSYEANVTALNASKNMVTKSLEIGK